MREGEGGRGRKREGGGEEELQWDDALSREIISGSRVGRDGVEEMGLAVELKLEQFGERVATSRSRQLLLSFLERTGRERPPSSLRVVF